MMRIEIKLCLRLKQFENIEILFYLGSVIDRNEVMESDVKRNSNQAFDAFSGLIKYGKQIIYLWKIR